MKILVTLLQNFKKNYRGVNLENAERIPVAVVIGTVFVLLVLAAILTLTFWFIYKRRRNLSEFSSKICTITCSRDLNTNI